MPRYMTQFAYTTEAWASLVNSPEDRAAILGELLDNLGGRLLDLHYCRGEYDGVFIFEAPDEATANAIVLSTITPGHIKATNTTELFTASEMMDALRKASNRRAL
jgi:uncharacterized protein with GYD domain